MQIEIADYDPDWPAQFERAAARIREALGADTLSLEHVGSTSVPGLPAKPVIDINLTVLDSAGEETYAPRLESAGYKLIVREPDWYEHRMFQGHDPRTNLHVFSQFCAEVARMRMFRDWLRRSPEDLVLYAETKRRLAAMNWDNIQNYADAKQNVVGEIMARAVAHMANELNS
jgi:GrpB-like predicted nucleotidyltransferase (UPF0157 family)